MNPLYPLITPTSIATSQPLAKPSHSTLHLSSQPTRPPPHLELTFSMLLCSPGNSCSPASLRLPNPAGQLSAELTPVACIGLRLTHLRPAPRWNTSCLPIWKPTPPPNAPKCDPRFPESSHPPCTPQNFHGAPAAAAAKKPPCRIKPPYGSQPPTSCRQLAVSSTIGVRHDKNRTA